MNTIIVPPNLVPVNPNTLTFKSPGRSGYLPIGVAAFTNLLGIEGIVPPSARASLIEAAFLAYKGDGPDIAKLHLASAPSKDAIIKVNNTSYPAWQTIGGTHPHASPFWWEIAKYNLPITPKNNQHTIQCLHWGDKLTLSIICAIHYPPAWNEVCSILHRAETWQGLDPDRNLPQTQLYERSTMWNGLPPDPEVATDDTIAWWMSEAGTPLGINLETLLEDYIRLS